MTPIKTLLRSLGFAVSVALMILAFSTAPAFAAGGGWGITGTFGSAGSGEIAVSEVGASKGDVYVADAGSNRIDVYSSTGAYLSQFAVADPGSIAVDNSASVSDPSKGDVYVTSQHFGSSYEGAVYKFSATGTPIFQFNPDTSEAWEIDAVAVDPSGDVLMEYRLGDDEGVFVQEFSDAAENTPATPVEISLFDHVARGLAVDSNDNFYIIDEAHTINKYSKTGETLGTVCVGCARGVAVEPGTNDLFDDTGTSVAQYGPFGEPFNAPVGGSRSGILTGGAGIAVDHINHEVYVADGGNDRIDVLTLGPGPETPETLPATEIESESAVLHGKLKSLSTEYYFEYNTGGACTGGSRTPLKQGVSGEAVEEKVKELEPGAHYTFCLVAEDTFGPNEPNSSQSFETHASRPVIVRDSLLGTSTTGGEFSAVIKPENEETTYYFEYSTEGSVVDNTLTAGEELKTTPAGTLLPEIGAHRVTVGGARLGENNTTYYYRLVAENATGQTIGNVQEYTKVPVVSNETSSDLTSTSVKLTATVNPEFQETKYRFEYSTSIAALENYTGTRIPGGSGIIPANGVAHCNDQSVPAFESGSFVCDDGSTPACAEGTLTPLGERLLCEITVDAETLSLQPGETYYYRLVAENETTENSNPYNTDKGKPADGEIESFKTPGRPAATTGAQAQNVTRTSATLSGTVNPEGAETTYSFQYISETAYQAALEKGVVDPYTEGETTAPVNVGSGATAVPAGPTQATGLRPDETYHYRIIATNRYGVRGTGEEHMFTTTTATPPTATTGAASAVSQNSATLSGTVTTNGLQTTYGFEIATTPGDYGPATGLGSIGGAASEEVHVTLGELEPGTTYYYRITATNADGTIPGLPGTFTTPGFPTLLNAPASPAPFTFTKVAFPKEEKGSGAGTTKGLTNKQKLAKALKQCKKEHGKTKRQKCEAAAHKKYSTAKAKKKKK